MFHNFLNSELDNSSCFSRFTYWTAEYPFHLLQKENVNNLASALSIAECKRLTLADKESKATKSAVSSSSSKDRNSVSRSKREEGKKSRRQGKTKNSSLWVRSHGGSHERRTRSFLLRAVLVADFVIRCYFLTRSHSCVSFVRPQRRRDRDPVVGLKEPRL